MRMLLLIPFSDRVLQTIIGWEYLHEERDDRMQCLPFQIGIARLQNYIKGL